MAWNGESVKSLELLPVSRHALAYGLARLTLDALTEGLKTLLKAETSEQVFAAVPLHYVGVSTMLLES